MERYDPEENKWEVIGSMAVPRYYFGCCELQGVPSMNTLHALSRAFAGNSFVSCREGDGDGRHAGSWLIVSFRVYLRDWRDQR